MSDAFKNMTQSMFVFMKTFYDLQKGRVLEYKVTDKNYILHVEVRKRILILFYTSLFLLIKLKAYIIFIHS